MADYDDSDLFDSRRRVTEKEAIAGLVEFGRRTAPPYSRSAYAEFRNRSPEPKPPSADTLLRLLGSFEGACRKAGLNVSGMKRVAYSDKEILDFFHVLRRFRQQRGGRGLPTIGDFRLYSQANGGEGISYDAFVRRLGSFRQFIENFRAHKVKGTSEAEFLTVCREVAVRRPKRELLSKGVRAEVLKKYDYTCQDCNRTQADLAPSKIELKVVPVKLHIGHKIAVKHGGKNNIENLTVECSDCNLGKGARIARYQNAERATEPSKSANAVNPKAPPSKGSKKVAKRPK